jgi:hypothetical protein
MISRPAAKKRTAKPSAKGKGQKKAKPRKVNPIESVRRALCLSSA